MMLNGNINVFYDEMKVGENGLEGVSTQVETHSTNATSRKIKELNDPSKGIYKGEKQSEEALYHGKNELQSGKLKVEHVDGILNTGNDHEHKHEQENKGDNISTDKLIEDAVEFLLKNPEIEEKLTKKEIKQRVERKANGEPTISQQTLENLKEEMLEEKYLYGSKKR